MKINMPVADTPSIDRWQKERQRMFKSVSAKGKTIEYLGKKFLVYKDTFWPFKDSQPLIKNFKIKRGESVLDIGTGSGVIAVFACYKGAGKVVAVDINPMSIKSSRYNAKLHGFDKIITVKQSNLFENIEREKFDVITANLPFRNKTAPDLVARSQWDTGLKTNKKFFEEAGEYLKPRGRIYFAQSNFGALQEIKKLARATGFSVRIIGRQSASKSDPKIFYALILKKVRQVHLHE